MSWRFKTGEWKINAKIGGNRNKVKSDGVILLMASPPGEYILAIFHTRYHISYCLF